MTVNRMVFAFAGVFILTGLGLHYYTQEIMWLFIPTFVGANLLQSAFTNFCPLAIILKKVGVKHG